MNRQNPSLKLNSTSPSAPRPLELPFENQPKKMLPVVAQPAAVSPYLRKIEPKTANPTPKIEMTSEVRSLYGAIDNVEDRLARRLDRLQKQLSAAQQKIEFQQKCFVLFILLCLGGICWAFTRSPAIDLPESKPQVQREQVALGMRTLVLI